VSNCISARSSQPAGGARHCGFTEILKHYEAHAPLKRNVLPDELGAHRLFLASDGAAAITGTGSYVDCGYQILGCDSAMTRKPAPRFSFSSRCFLDI